MRVMQPACHSGRLDDRRLDRPLDRAFYARPTEVVAPDLLGRLLVRAVDGHTRAGRIVEVEAYGGPDDLASHAARSQTGRARIMFGPPGIAYVYLIYGVYNCLNAVTGPEGAAGAVLIRALEPVPPLVARTDGPGRLCRALAIDRSLNGEPLDGDRLWIAGEAADDRAIAVGPRVGIEYAGVDAARPWRFWLRGNRHVSRLTGRAR